jgi:hypothetical protein
MSRLISSGPPLLHPGSVPRVRIPHSFSAPDQRSGTRRMRPCPANCPNHRDRPMAPIRAVFVSLGALSPKQPNHGGFGTDVRSSKNQNVTGCPKGSEFERAPLRRNEPESNHSVPKGPSLPAARILRQPSVRTTGSAAGRPCGSFRARPRIRHQRRLRRHDHSSIFLRQYSPPHAALSLRRARRPAPARRRG